MTILYLTATGNCLYAAKKIGGTLISIPQALKSGSLVFEDSAVGIAFPVFGLSVPPYILAFLQKAKIHCDYLFAVLTYGFYAGGAAWQLEQEAAKYGFCFSYIRTVRMTMNYLPSYNMEKEIAKGLRHGSSELEQTAAEIQARVHSKTKNTAFERFMTRVHQKHYAFPTGAGVTEKYSIGTSCHGCGVCEKVCPMDNVSLKNGIPQFGKNCISCLACVQNCPVGAIRLAGEKGTARYRNKDILLEEIVAANK